MELQGSWLGALAADLRDYASTAEIVFFFVHHAVIISVPLFYLAWGTFPIYPFELVGTWMLSIVQHWMIYLPISILSGWHIQYMCHPPKQLRVMTHNYRLLMLAGSFGITWFTHTTTMVLSGYPHVFGIVDVTSLAIFVLSLFIVFVRKPDKSLKNY